MALVALSVVEQRLDAVRAVLSGVAVTEVAAGVGVSRQSVHEWVVRYLSEGLPGLADRSRRPRSSPGQASAEVEARVAEMRRLHPRWGATRIRLDMLQHPHPTVPMGVVPSVRTVNRILVRLGLLTPRPRKRPKKSYRRWQRPGPMQLWQMDIVGGVMLVDPGTGELREVKVVTGVDDHSRYCVVASVVERATGRAVCLAFAGALARFGIPHEVLTDNGKQFTERFGKGGEVLFDKICRKNGIAHRLTAPASPTTTGKIERFHLTLRRELLDDAEPFTSLAAAQAAVDGFVRDYNHARPHQALDVVEPVTPGQRFSTEPDPDRALLPVWLPPTIAPSPPEPEAAASVPGPGQATAAPALAASVDWSGGPVELDRVVPASGNMWLAGRQIWLGPDRAGLTVRFWADTTVIHVLIGGARVKTVRSHLSVVDVARLVASGATAATSPSPLPAVEDGAAVEVDRCIARNGTISLAGRWVMVQGEVLAGRRVTVRMEPSTLMLFDPNTRELLRTLPNPLSPAQVQRLHGLRPAGPPPRPSTEPVRVQRRTDRSGTLMVCGQRVSLGRDHAHQTLRIAVSDTTLAIDLNDGETRVVRRSTSRPPRGAKAAQQVQASPVPGGGPIMSCAATTAEP